MKLISCDGCAVILDQDKLSFALDMYNEEGNEIDKEKAEYNQAHKCYEPYVKCPVCNAMIFQDG